MENKVFEIIRKLTPKQRRDLLGFVKVSSNHLTKEKERILSNLITAVKQNETLPEGTFVKTLPPKEQNRWTKTKTEFLKTLKRYLIMDLTAEDDFFGNLRLLKFFLIKGLWKNHDGLWNHVNKQLKKNKTISVEQHLHKFLLFKIRARKAKEIRKWDENLYAAEKELDHYYTLQKMMMLCEKTNRSRIINTQVNEEDLHFLEKKAEQTDCPLLQLYYTAYKMLKIPDVERHYEEVVNLFYKMENNLDFKTINGIPRYLMNYCIAKVNQGKPTYAEKYIRVFEFMDKKGLLLEDGKLESHHLKNAAAMAMMIKKYAWLEKLLDEKSGLVSCPDGFDITRFVKIKLHFHMGEKLDKEDRNFLLTSSKDVFHRLDVRKLLLMIMFQNNENNFTNELLGFERYVKNRKKLPETKKAALATFIRCLKMLEKGKTLKLSEMEKKPPVLDCEWLKRMEKRNEGGST